MEKLSRVEAWKLQIAQKMELENVETILEEACKKIMEKAYPEGPHGVIERVDIREKETVVFISGNERTVKAFSDTLKEGIPRVKITALKVSQANIIAFK